MDGLELNLFKSEKLIKKKKEISKSKKQFLKNKIKKQKLKDKPKKKRDNFKKDSIKKEVDQNKEILTLQSEFSSGLNEAKKNNVKKDNKKLEYKKVDYKKNIDNEKDDLKKQIEFNKDDNLTASKQHLKSTTEFNKPNDKPINNLAVSMINNEFSDGLSSRDGFKNNLKRKPNDEEGSNFKNVKRFNRKDNSSPNHFNHFNRHSNRQSNSSSTEDLKDDFNKLFSSKNKMERLKGDDKSSNSFDRFNSNQRFKKDDQSFKDRKGFISNCFSENPERPDFKLQNLKDEHKEDVFKCEETFESLSGLIHPHLISFLASKLNIIKLTNVQSKSIPVILNKHDCLVKSVTGSGKTLAYIIPIIQRLQEKTPKISRNDGIFALIIVPTRELVMQCYNILESLCKVS